MAEIATETFFYAKNPSGHVLLDSKFIRFDHSGNSTLRSFSALLYILVYPLLPVGAERFTGTDGAYRFADDLVIQCSAFFITLVINSAIGTDTETLCFGCGIDVGFQEEKLPAVLFISRTSRAE